jgi:hypothetical protein
VYDSWPCFYFFYFFEITLLTLKCVFLLYFRSVKIVKQDIICVFKCWILLKPVLECVDGNLHFPVPSMNRLNPAESVTFLISSCWVFFRDSVFLYLNVCSRAWKICINSYVHNQSKLMTMSYSLILFNFYSSLWNSFLRISWKGLKSKTNGKTRDFSITISWVFFF